MTPTTKTDPLDEIDANQTIKMSCPTCWEHQTGTKADYKEFATKHFHKYSSVHYISIEVIKPRTVIKPPAKKAKPDWAKRECKKCGGTGFYCEGYQDGQPYSHTGFACYDCDGTGWK